MIIKEASAKVEGFFEISGLYVKEEVLDPFSRVQSLLWEGK